MTFDAKLKWSVICALAAVALGAGATAHFRIALVDLAGLVALATLLAGACLYCHRRKWTVATGSFVAVLQFVLFTCCYTAVTCVIAAAALPLVDGYLQHSDQWLRVDLPAVVAWAVQRPVLDQLLTFSYHTVVLQTLLTIFLLGWLSGIRDIELFVTRLMLAALLTLVLFALFPAVGPLDVHRYDLMPGQLHYVETLRDLRSGAKATVRFFVVEGLITFPSFHAAWAVILVVSYARHHILLLAFGIVNTAVILSTMTTGWHYGTDVVAGIGVAAAAIAGGTGLHRIGRRSAEMG